MQTKLSGNVASHTMEPERVSAPDQASTSPYIAENFLMHMAPVSIGVFFFGNFHPNAEDKVQAQRALYKTSFLYRHFLQSGGLKVVIDENSLTLTGKTTSSAVSLMAYLLGTQIMGPSIKIADETTRVEEHGRPLKPTDKPVDGELRARLQLMLATDAMLGSEEFEVTVTNGAAKVSGQVSSPSHKVWAETLLHSVAPQAKLTITVSGKASTHGEPKTRPSIDDDSLQALALTRIKIIPALAGLELRAASQRQGLTLSGTVHTAVEKELADSAVKHTFGLRDFKSSITIKG